MERWIFFFAGADKNACLKLMCIYIDMVGVRVIAMPSFWMIPPLFSSNSHECGSSQKTSMVKMKWPVGLFAIDCWSASWRFVFYCHCHCLCDDGFC